MTDMPTKPGVYWAKLRMVDPGTQDEDIFEPVDEWEAVEVFENSLDEEDNEYLRVFVPGILKSQSLENFFWAKPIVALEPPL